MITADERELAKRVIQAHPDWDDARVFSAIAAERDQRKQTAEWGPEGKPSWLTQSPEGAQRSEARGKLQQEHPDWEHGRIQAELGPYRPPVRRDYPDADVAGARQALQDRVDAEHAAIKAHADQMAAKHGTGETAALGAQGAVSPLMHLMGLPPAVGADGVKDQRTAEERKQDDDLMRSAQAGAVAGGMGMMPPSNFTAAGRRERGRQWDAANQASSEAAEGRPLTHMAGGVTAGMVAGAAMPETYVAKGLGALMSRAGVAALSNGARVALPAINSTVANAAKNIVMAPAVGAAGHVIREGVEGRAPTMEGLKDSAGAATMAATALSPMQALVGAGRGAVRASLKGGAAESFLRHKAEGNITPEITETPGDRLGSTMVAERTLDNIVGRMGKEAQGWKTLQDQFNAGTEETRLPSMAKQFMEDQRAPGRLNTDTARPFNKGDRKAYAKMAHGLGLGKNPEPPRAYNARHERTELGKKIDWSPAGNADPNKNVYQSMRRALHADIPGQEWMDDNITKSMRRLEEQRALLSLPDDAPILPKPGPPDANPSDFSHQLDPSARERAVTNLLRYGDKSQPGIAKSERLARLADEFGHHDLMAPILAKKAYEATRWRSPFSRDTEATQHSLGPSVKGRFVSDNINALARSIGERPKIAELLTPNEAGQTSTAMTSTAAAAANTDRESKRKKTAKK